MTNTIPTKQPGDFVIAHATDLRPEGGVAFAHSVALARDAGARLISLHANPKADGRPMPDAAPLLERWAPDAPAIEHHKITHECCDEPVDTLLDALRRVDADLLVVGTQQWTGLGRALHESVAEAVAGQGKVPTLVLPIGKSGFVDDDGRLNLKRVLLPIGDQQEAETAFKAITCLFDRLGLSDLDIHLLRVGDDALDTIQPPRRTGIRWHKERRDGNVIDQIMRTCVELRCDLVVMASRGQDGFLDLFRGSQTQRLIRSIDRALLAVPVRS
jgi:nucleotide-binding universal stress UspA family protein